MFLLKSDDFQEFIDKVGVISDEVSLSIGLDIQNCDIPLISPTKAFLNSDSTVTHIVHASDMACMPHQNYVACEPLEAESERIETSSTFSIPSMSSYLVQHTCIPSHCHRHQYCFVPLHPPPTSVVATHPPPTSVVTTHPPPTSVIHGLEARWASCLYAWRHGCMEEWLHGGMDVWGTMGGWLPPLGQLPFLILMAPPPPGHGESCGSPGRLMRVHCQPAGQEAA